jgi:putative ABC transport system permease protein
MTGIVWGIVAVTMLIAYGGGFRSVLMASFESFGKSAVVGWPGQTSSQAGGERAGKRVVLEDQDLENIRAEANLVRTACFEYVRWLGLSAGERYANTAIRGVCPEYADMRNEVPSLGRFINSSDIVERRRVIFIGARLREKLFGTRNPLGETIKVGGMSFTVIGTMDRKLQMSNYFTSDDESAWIPFTTAGDLYNTRYASVIVFAPVAPQFEKKAQEQVRAVLAKRQGFNPTDKRSIQMFGREEFRPIIEGISIGLQLLLTFIGALTLGIGGVGVMNIMLVSVDERIREIGVRRALGATKNLIKVQFLMEALVLMIIGGIIGILLSYLISWSVGTLPMLGALFEDDSGQGDIRLVIDSATVFASAGILLIVGLMAGIVPALKASRMDPVEALRYE